MNKGGRGRTVVGEGEEVGQTQSLFFSKPLKFGQNRLRQVVYGPACKQRM